LIFGAQVFVTENDFPKNDLSLFYDKAISAWVNVKFTDHQISK